MLDLAFILINSLLGFALCWIWLLKHIHKTHKIVMGGHCIWLIPNSYSCELLTIVSRKVVYSIYLVLRSYVNQRQLWQQKYDASMVAANLSRNCVLKIVIAVFLSTQLGTLL